jgi:hypothetical protein
MRRYCLLGLVFVFAWCGPLTFVRSQQKGRDAATPLEQDAIKGTESKKDAAQKEKKKKPSDKVNAKKMVRRGIDWLVEAQHPDGGWGAGSHAHQDIRDPAAVPSDPATTAFAATAFLKAGHTPIAGEHRDVVIAATRFLVKAVEAAEPKNEKITSLTGTQPQTKLGSLIDTAMAAQFLTRVSELMPKHDPLSKRIDKALTECLRRLQQTQKADGSWSGGGGWAPVLQAAMNCSSLELAKAAGRKVDGEKLERARQYQKSNVNPVTGSASSSKSAGVELYAFAGGIRGNAADAFQATEAIKVAKREGKLAQDAPVNEENLRIAGQDEEMAKKLGDANRQNTAQLRRLDDEQLLAGFGNNGGEEFLSYLMTSESLVIAGGDSWKKWNNKMKQRLGKVQNGDGSWSGHHCITSPVFCTAAALQVITTERDVKMLKRIAAVTE